MPAVHFFYESAVCCADQIQPAISLFLFNHGAKSFSGNLVLKKKSKFEQQNPTQINPNSHPFPPRSNC